LVKLRLTRLGKKKQPFYRIVAMHSTTGRQGQALGLIGTYDPLHASVDINEENALLWLNRGAEMTETVEALFRSQGVLARWKGFEASADENALKGDKPKRRRKLAAASAAPAVEAKEEATEETADTPAEEPAEEKSEE
jgi:small subunit ribosomal protein S16